MCIRTDARRVGHEVAHVEPNVSYDIRPQAHVVAETFHFSGSQSCRTFAECLLVS